MFERPRKLGDAFSPKRAQCRPPREQREKGGGRNSPGPAPQSGTTKIEAAGAGVKVTVDQTFPGGITRNWGYTANYDGKDSPVTGNNPDADTVARTRVNATTVKLVNKKAGKITTTNSSVVSSDGKTRTVTTTGTNAQGQTVNNVAVFEKQ